MKYLGTAVIMFVLGFAVGRGIITIDVNVNDNELEEAVETVSDTANDVVETARKINVEVGK